MPNDYDRQNDDKSLEETAQAASKGNRAAFEELARTCQPSVWRYAFSVLGERELADEVAQETWARAVRSIRRFRGNSSVLTWLISIERRVIADILSERSRQPPLHRKDECEVIPVEQFPSASIEIASLLRALPSEMRDAIILTQVMGLTYDEAADVLNTKSGTVKSRVFRAREFLVETFRELPVEQSSEEAR